MFYRTHETKTPGRLAAIGPMMGSLGLYLETADIRSWGRGKLAARRWPAKVLSDLWKYVLGSQSVAKYVLWLSWGSQSLAKYILQRS